MPIQSADLLAAAAKWLRRVAVLIAAGFFLLFLYAAAVRIQYPFELECQEGGSLAVVERFLSGEGMYGSPSLEYVPLIYPPFYSYVSAAAAWVLGSGFLPLRLVSVLSSVVSFVLVYGMVRRETGCRLCGFVAAGVLAATYRISGDWFDVARVDALFVLLTLAAFYCARTGTPGSLLAAGVLFSLSFFTKQMALAPFVSILAFYVLVDWRGALYLAGAAVSTTLVGILLFDHASDGWYSFYVFDLAAQHVINHPLRMLVMFAFYLVTLPLSLCYLLSAAFLLLSQEGGSGRKSRLFYGLAGGGMLVASTVGWLNPPAYVNVLMPGYAALAVLFGLGMARVLEVARAAGGGRGEIVRAVVYGGCILQLAALVYVPRLPTQEDLEAGNRLVAELEQVEGDVFIPAHGYLGVLAGKADSAHWIAICELKGHFGGEETAEWRELYEDLVDALEDQRYGLVVVSSDDLVEEIERGYVLEGRVFDDESVFWTLSGVEKRPEYRYVPRGGAGAE